MTGMTSITYCKTIMFFQTSYSRYHVNRTFIISHDYPNDHCVGILVVSFYLYFVGVIIYLIHIICTR